jgi:hypothetical protein
LDLIRLKRRNNSFKVQGSIVQAPTSFLPRGAGEDEGGGLNRAERLNIRTR